MKTFTERICKNCGGKFSILVSYLKYEKKRRREKSGIYCSRKCRDESHRRPESWGIKSCIKCGKKFKAWVYFNQKYCSRKCSGKEWKDRVTKTCVGCGKQYEITKAREKTTRFCSHKCLNNWLSSDKETKRKMAQSLRRRFENKENHPNWQGGISFEPYSPEFNNKLKTQIRKRDDNQCQVCGTRQNGRKFPVHHIDYDKKNNNSLNLISLCDFHHLLTNGDRDKWQFFFESYQEIRLPRIN